MILTRSRVVRTGEADKAHDDNELFFRAIETVENLIRSLNEFYLFPFNIFSRRLNKLSKIRVKNSKILPSCYL